MNELAKASRSAMRAKANRLGGGGGGKGSNDPVKKVDASSWTPPPALDAGRKTGARPLRARIYKHGGKIQGDRAPRHAGKTPRGGYKDGGKVGTGPLSMANVANENKRDFGSFHEGGYKHGGVPKAGHDMAAIKAAVHKHEKHDHKGEALTKLRHGGRPKRAAGGKAEKYWSYQPSEDTPSLAHALDAKVIHPDTTEADWTKMSPGMRREIVRSAKKRPERARGGRTKGKTNINIVIAQPHQQPPPNPMQGPTRPPMPPPQPPPQMPPPAANGPPGGAGPIPAGAAPGGPPPMMRKAGGRTYRKPADMDAGAMSGMGRLEKTEIQEHRR